MFSSALWRKGEKICHKHTNDSQVIIDTMLTYWQLLAQVFLVPGQLLIFEVVVFRSESFDGGTKPNKVQGIVSAGDKLSRLRNLYRISSC